MLEIHLNRSHYSQLAIGAAVTGVGDELNDWREPAMGVSGWSTRFDGGGNNVPPTVIALYANGSEWETEEGYQPYLYSLATWFEWGQENKKHEQLLRHRRFATGNPDQVILLKGGMNILESVHEYAVRRVSAEDANWGRVNADDVPEHVLPTLKKVTKTVYDLFGQGHEFFEIK